MNYMVSDVETASNPAGKTHEFGVPYSDQAAGPVLGAQLLKHLMEADSAAYLKRVSIFLLPG